jgi:TldD protein
LKDQISKVLNWLNGQSVDYADIRIVDQQYEDISTNNLTVEKIQNSRSKGYGIRVIFDGSLGFASSQDFDLIQDTAAKALLIAKSSRELQTEKIILSPKDIIVDHYKTPIEKDPFAVPMAEKIQLLLSAEETMRASGDLSRTWGNLNFQRIDKIFADTEGSYITQELYESGGGIVAYATHEGDTQLRSYPNCFRGNVGTAGYEFVEKLDLVGNASRIGTEATELVRAEECPSGHFDIIIDSDQLQLQIHESIGHPVELDRIFGSEAAYAGMSFVHTGMIEEGFKYGSEHVTVVADGTLAGALGTFGYDDDGVKAQKTTIIDKGILKNFISSRDTASKIGQASNGTNRADGWQNIPIVRMTNINLMPGNFELDELVSGVENGLFLKTNRSWSIDDKRVNFQFGTEIAYEIKEGQLTGKIYKNPIYSGITPEFWGSCDGIANESYWRVYGTPNCGKGEPGQVAHVAHGASPARFRNVKVGVSDVK